MSVYAKINSENIVENVVIVELATESANKNWLEQNLGGEWIQTFTRDEKEIRGIPAGKGCIYLREFDRFVPPQFFSSWTLNYETFEWDPPVAKPNDGKVYYWDEDLLNWVEK